MTEKQLVELGFEKQEDYDGVCDYYYYTLRVARGLEFISNSNDECDHDDDWFIEFFESDPTIRWKDIEAFKELLSAINKGEFLK